MEEERRQFIRKSSETDEIFVYCRKSSCFAVVKDISQGGIKLEYSPYTAEWAEWRLIDILVKDINRFIVLSIPCKVIYDVQQLSENKTFRGSENRIIGLQFQNLTDEQQHHLGTLIQWLSLAQ
jgi:hypothetical protein